MVVFAEELPWGRQCKAGQEAGAGDRGQLKEVGFDDYYDDDDDDDDDCEC